jgi:uncharacterized protein (DUF4415 family)
MPDLLKKLMRTNKGKNPSEAVKAMIARIEHAASHPELFPFVELPEDSSLQSIDLDVEFDIDFSVPPPERKPSGPSPAISAAGTKKVTIRIPNRIIDAFKANARASGRRYQTEVNRALEKAAQALPR